MNVFWTPLLFRPLSNAQHHSASMYISFPASVPAEAMLDTSQHKAARYLIDDRDKTREIEAIAPTGPSTMDAVIVMLRRLREDTATSREWKQSKIFTKSLGIKYANM